MTRRQGKKWCAVRAVAPTPLGSHNSEATPRPQEDEAERYLLVLRFLEGSSCTAAFEALKREAAEHGLLGSRTDWTGASRPTTYERELDRRAPSLPSEHLPQLLDMVQRLSREREPVATRLSAPPWSLLRQGTLSLVEPSAAPLAGPRALGSRSEELPRTSLAWSARLTPRLPLPEMLRRRRAPSGHEAAAPLHMLQARQLGLRIPAVLAPPRSLYAVREGGTGGMRLYSGLVGHVGAVYCCLCDRTGSRLITGSDDANIKIWSTETGLLQHTLRGHKGEITELAISPDNATLVSSSTDGTARVWRLRDGWPVAVLSRFSGAVNGLAFSPSLRNPWLLTLGHDASVLLWNTRDWSAPPLPLRKPSPPADPAASSAPSASSSASSGAAVAGVCCTFNPTGTLVAVGSTHAPYVLAWSLHDAHRRFAEARGGALASGHVRAEIAVDGCEEGEGVEGGERGEASGGGEGGGGGATSRSGRAARLRQQGALPPLLPIELPGHNGEVDSVSFSRRGDELLTGARDGCARLWRWKGRLRSLRSIGMWPPQEAYATAAATLQGGKPPVVWVDMAAWSCDGLRAYTSDSLRKRTRENPCLASCLRVWETARGALLHTLPYEAGPASLPVYVLLPHPTDPAVLASAGYDGVVRLWDTRQGRSLGELPHPPADQWQPSPEQAALPMLLDGAWGAGASSGMLAVSSASGALLLMGSGHEPRLQTAPSQQFFAADLHPLVHDLHHAAIDQTSGLEPHRNARTPLSDLQVVK